MVSAVRLALQENEHLRNSIFRCTFAVGDKGASVSGILVELKMPTKPFKGTIKLDVCDSVPDSEPYTPTKAPAGAPNVLFVLYDDSGQAAFARTTR